METSYYWHISVSFIEIYQLLWLNHATATWLYLTKADQMWDISTGKRDREKALGRLEEAIEQKRME